MQLVSRLRRSCISESPHLCVFEQRVRDYVTKAPSIKLSPSLVLTLTMLMCGFRYIS